MATTLKWLRLLERVKGIGPSTRSLGNSRRKASGAVFCDILVENRAEHIENLKALCGHSADVDRPPPRLHACSWDGDVHIRELGSAPRAQRNPTPARGRYCSASPM